MKPVPPTAEELVGPPPHTLDEKAVLAHFLGRTVQQIREDLPRNGGAYQEDFMWMAPAGLRFYLPAVLDYLKSAEANDDFLMSYGMISSLASQVEKATLSAEVLTLVRAIADLVDAGRTRFGFTPDDPILNKNLRRIRHSDSRPDSPPPRHNPID